MKTQKSHQRELGSSLPYIGGGDTMRNFNKWAVLLQLLKLLLEIFRFFNK